MTLPDFMDADADDGQGAEMEAQEASADAAEAQEASDHDDECYLCTLPGELLCCDACSNAYHLHCLGLQAIPEGDYLCPVCCAEKEGVPPPKKGSLKPKVVVPKPKQPEGVKKKRGRPPKVRDSANGSEPEAKKRKAPAAARPRARSSGDSDGPASDPGEAGGEDSPGSNGEAQKAAKRERREAAKGKKKRRDATESDEEFDRALMMDDEEARQAAAARAKAKARAGASAGDGGDLSDHEGACGVCNEGGELLCCDFCPKVFHTGCLQMDAVPEGDWACPVCASLEQRVDRILARRLRREPAPSPSPPPEGVKEEPKKEKEGEGREVEEFYVKWQGRSYRHCGWVRRFVLEKVAKAKLRYFLEELEEEEEAGPEAAELGLEDEGTVNGVRPEWLDVERVIGRRAAEGGAEGPEYLCKWRGLPYADCTWEAEADLLPAAQPQVESFLVREGLRPAPPPPAFGPGSRLPAFRSRGDPFYEFPKQPPFVAGGELHAYQLEGLNWLRWRYNERINCILADEMGLGKTVQCVAFVSALLWEYGARPFLVLGPLATLPNWQREFEKWAPHMHVVLYYGDQDSRTIIREREFFRPAEGRSGTRAPKLDVLLTSYELAFRDAAHLRRFRFASLVVDEGHRLKNSAGKLFQALADFNADHRVLLTGTPLQNEQRELFNLLQFLDPAAFKSFGDFQMDLDTGDRAAQVARLHEVLRPRMLRRIKKDVLSALPPKQEFIVRVELTRRQREMYKNIFTRNYEALAKGAKRAGAAAFGNVVMELRKCCNHPFLFETALEEASALAARDPSELGRLRVEWCGKLELLDRMLAKLKAQGHRVIVFSQMTRVLDILEDYCRGRGHAFERLDGGVASVERQAAIDRFNAPGSPSFVFLLSTRAGGVGINLATADTVVIYDSDWNPHNDIQALSRAHRIGQERKVMIYRMVTRRTVEERMVQRAKSKLTLELLLVKKMDGAGRSMKEKELEDILKFGAEAIFAEGKEGAAGEGKEDGEAADRIFYDEAAVDKLLDRSQEAAEERSEADNEYLGSFKVARLWQSRAEGDEPPEDDELAALEGQDEDAPAGRRRRGRPAAKGPDTEKRYWEFLREGYESLQAHRHAAMGKGRRRRNVVTRYSEGRGDSSSSSGSESGESFRAPPDDEGHASGGESPKAEPAKKEKEKKGKAAKDEAADWFRGPEHPLLEGSGKELKVLGFDAKERQAFWNLFARFGADLRTICLTVAGHGVRGIPKRRGRGGPLSKKTPYEIRRYGKAFLSWISQPSGPPSQDKFADGVPKEAVFGAWHLWRVREGLARLGALSLLAAKVRESEVRGDKALAVKTHVPTDWHRAVQSLAAAPAATPAAPDGAGPSHPPPARARWTPEHDLVLLKAVVRHGYGEWRAVANDDGRALHTAAALELELPPLSPPDASPAPPPPPPPAPPEGAGPEPDAEAKAAEAKAKEEEAARERERERERRDERILNFLAKRLRLVEGALLEEHRATLPQPPPPPPMPPSLPIPGARRDPAAMATVAATALMSGPGMMERVAAYIAASSAARRQLPPSAAVTVPAGGVLPAPGPPRPVPNSIPVVPARPPQPGAKPVAPPLPGTRPVNGGPHAGRPQRRRRLLPEGLPREVVQPGIVQVLRQHMRGAGEEEATLRDSLALDFLRAETTAHHASRCQATAEPRALAAEMVQVAAWAAAAQRSLAAIRELLPARPLVGAVPVSAPAPAPAPAPPPISVSAP